MDKEYKNKIQNFYDKNKRMPTYTEMMKVFGFKSKNAVFKLVNKMLEAGFVSKDHLGRLMPASNFGEIPFLGSIKAGLPSDAEEEVFDTINLDDLLVKNKTYTYLLEVDGDSMIDAHIEEGDMVLVEKASQAKEGDIVIAEVDGEFTMKYLRKTNGKYWLEAANKNYKPIHPVNSFSIGGVVKAVVRKY